jgi:hypothetical protein
VPSWPRLGNPYLLSNIRRGRRPLIEEAIRVSGRYDLWTTDEAGGVLAGNDGYFGLWLQGDRSHVDCSDFWHTVELLEMLPEWSVYLKPSDDR